MYRYCVRRLVVNQLLPVDSLRIYPLSNFVSALSIKDKWSARADVVSNDTEKSKFQQPKHYLSKKSKSPKSLRHSESSDTVALVSKSFSKRADKIEQPKKGHESPKRVSSPPKSSESERKKESPRRDQKRPKEIFRPLQVVNNSQQTKSNAAEDNEENNVGAELVGKIEKSQSGKFI